MTDFTFGPFAMHAAGARLLRDGAEVRLRPRAFRALEVLLLHRGEYIGYEQMMAEAWTGTFVSRHTIDVTVREAKRSLGEYARWVVHRPKLGYCLEVPTSDELVRKGWHFLSRRTHEGAERAIECFQQAGEECPADFRAFDGLSTCLLMLATFGMRPPGEVYGGFLAAHERAVALGGLRPELRCNRAHGLHLFEHKLDEAHSEFLRAMQEKPTCATAHVRTALLYGTLGRLDDALDIIERGYRADPLLPTLPATDVLVRVWRRDFAGAIAVGPTAVELHPYLQVARVNYAQALEFSGRLDDALAQYERASIMFPDLPWLRALEGTCLAKMGRTREACAILAELEQRRRTDYVDAYFMAVLHGVLGHPADAFRELRRALDENAAPLYALDVDPKMDAFRGDPRFARLRRAPIGPRNRG
jgi:DNA-binding winged helix-turn-helix (wHTH) protein/Flp pilus assembly protein TadD